MITVDTNVLNTLSQEPWPNLSQFKSSGSGAATQSIYFGFNSFDTWLHIVIFSRLDFYCSMWEICWVELLWPKREAQRHEVWLICKICYLSVAIIPICFWSYQIWDNGINTEKQKSYQHLCCCQHWNRIVSGESLTKVSYNTRSFFYFFLFLIFFLTTCILTHLIIRYKSPLIDRDSNIFFAFIIHRFRDSKITARTLEIRSFLLIVSSLI